MVTRMDWLFLRGLSREQRHWGSFPDVFRAKVKGARVHCLDLPGTGTELHRESPVTVREIMADVRRRHLALRAENPGPWGLLAMSLGGMVAMAWAADHPDDFSRVVLANTSASDVGKPWDRMQPTAIATTVRVMLSRDPVERERRVLGMVTRRLRDRDAVARAWAEIHRTSPVSRATVVRQLLAATRFRAPAKIDPPVLILIGAADALASPACGHALAQRFGAPIEIHPDGGHELALDAPEWLADRIAAWSSAS